MTLRFRLYQLMLAGAALSIAACSDVTTPTVQDPAAAAGPMASRGIGIRGNPALSFDGTTANASTPNGSVITTRIDNLIVDAMVKYNGPNATNSHQTLFYNGNGAVTGWGILILGTADGVAPGTVAILAGGQQLIPTGLVLAPGRWHHIFVERSLRNITTLLVDDQAISLGAVNAVQLGGSYTSIEHTSVGGDGTFDAPSGDLNGVVDDLTLMDATTRAVIERWTFDEGRGATTRGVNGGVLQLGHTGWVADDRRVEDHDGGNSALGFDGSTANASTPKGNPAFTQTENLGVAFQARFNGASASDGHQTLYYNGNGAARGWGILALGVQDGYPTGTLAVLAGGITIAATPFVLQPGRWVSIRVKRGADGHTWFAVNDSVVDLGVIPVNPVAPADDILHNIWDYTSVGGDGTFDAPTGSFNGLIDDLSVRDLGSGHLIDRWQFNEGSGAVATGDRGGMLFVGSAHWTRRGFDHGFERGFGHGHDARGRDNDHGHGRP